MVIDELDELRTWPSDRLLAARDEAVVEERRWRLRRVTLDRVLDERGTSGADPVGWVQARDKVRATTARAEVEIARELESLPAMRAAAERGELSFDQLEHLVVLATPETDAEWAVRGAAAAPSDLAHMVRRSRVVSAKEADARQEARELSWWRSPDGGMLRIRGAIPDVDGAFVEAVFEHLINTMKPPRGEPWDTRAHRGADGLVALCRAYRCGEGLAPKSWRPRVVVHSRPSDGTADVNGIPIAAQTVTRLIADGALVRHVRDDDPLTNPTGDDIPAALRDYVSARDPQCRRPGCETTIGLQAHHLTPRCRGGPTDKHSVVMVCTPDHRQLEPHGPYRLEGDAEQPDGLTWHHRDDPPPGNPPAHAGPDPP